MILKMVRRSISNEAMLSLDRIGGERELIRMRMREVSALFIIIRSELITAALVSVSPPIVAALTIEPNEGFSFIKMPNTWITTNKQSNRDLLTSDKKLSLSFMPFFFGILDIVYDKLKEGEEEEEEEKEAYIISMIARHTQVSYHCETINNKTASSS
jgi:hypothetical protein